MTKKDIKSKTLIKVKRAMMDYGMVSDGDRIAVGLSGGKDSGVLLYILEEVRKTVPFNFEIHGIFLDLGFGIETASLVNFCKGLKIPFTQKATDIREIIFDIRKEKNPCSLCANLRRGALNDLAVELGCNKVALGHHLDDLVDTFFISLFYSGKLQTFAPSAYLSRVNLTMIRPLVYINEESVKELAVLENVPIVKNPCPANGHTKREEIKNLVKNLRYQYPDLREKILASLKGADMNNLWPDVIPRQRRTKTILKGTEQ